MADLSGGDIKAFIGSKEFELSRDFYLALGFQLNFEQDDLAEFEFGNSRFYLQRYYQRKWVENSMLHITVDDAGAWHEHVVSVLRERKYGAARTRPPKLEDYGALVTYVWDPAGVLLHFAQPLPNKLAGVGTGGEA